jgi:hypothetical protein
LELHFARFSGRNLIVSSYFDFRSQFPEILGDVESKAVVVVD